MDEVKKETITSDEVEANLAEVVSNPEEIARITEMVELGVIRGRKHSRTNPKMNKYIFGSRRGVDIFDTDKIEEALKKAGTFLNNLKKEGKTVLVVCTKPALVDILEDFSKKYNFPIVNKRWLGGTLTNWKTISKRIDVLKKLKDDEAKGLLNRYTKKERLMLNRKMEKLEVLFSGISTMKSLPSALFVVDSLAHITAVKEANILKIPVIGLLNTDNNPELVNYPIPCNDDARSSVTFVLDNLGLV